MMWHMQNGCVWQEEKEKDVKKIINQNEWRNGKACILHSLKMVKAADQNILSYEASF